MKFVSEEISAYCEAHSQTLSPLLIALAAETRSQVPGATMLVGTLEGNLLRLLIRLTGAKKVLEIGTFTGYSALTMAEALPEDGKLITCDVNPDSTAVARRYWEQSPHGHKISLKLAPALQTLETIRDPLDMVFIDADKENYLNYWKACLPKLRQGGLIVVDNVLWSGRVLRPESESDHAIASLNDYAVQDERVECVMLPIRDGMLLAWKK